MLKLTSVFFIKEISIIVHILIANVRLFMKQERIDQKKFHILYIYCLLRAQNDTNCLFCRLYVWIAIQMLLVIIAFLRSILKVISSFFYSK